MLFCYSPKQRAQCNWTTNSLTQSPLDIGRLAAIKRRHRHSTLPWALVCLSALRPMLDPTPPALWSMFSANFFWNTCYSTLNDWFRGKQLILSASGHIEIRGKQVFTWFVIERKIWKLVTAVVGQHSRWQCTVTLWRHRRLQCCPLRDFGGKQLDVIVRCHLTSK